MAQSIPEKHETERQESPNSKSSNEFDNGVGLPIEQNEKYTGNDWRRKSTIPENIAPDGRRIITEEEAWPALGYCWPTWKKWMLLSSIFIVQCSMNMNTSIYPSAVEQIAEHFHVNEQVARCGQMIFLVMYAFGCELWAPWSEEFGRWPVLQISLFFVNIWQIPVGLAPNIASLIIGRGLGGLSSAGGSVTLGMVADLWESDRQQYALAYVVFSSVGGTSIGPIAGGPVAAYLSWRWNIWVQLIFGVVVQVIHFFMPESRTTILMDKEAKRRRKNGEDIWGPNEVKNPRISMKEFAVTWRRPFEMFFREPIVLSMSLLSGFSDALIFTCAESFPLVFEQWGFSTVQLGFTFFPIIIGYVIAYASYFPWIHKDHNTMRKYGVDSISPEHRLYWLLYLVPFLPIGLFGFAWTSTGPPIHWIAPMIFAVCIAIANYAIYMSTIDYMVAAYGAYSASATGGNGFARDFLAGVSAMYTHALYERVGGELHLAWASTILACLAVIVCIPIYYCYWKGPTIREKSKFAQSLNKDRKDRDQRRSTYASVSGQGHRQEVEA